MDTNPESMVKLTKEWRSKMEDEFDKNFSSDAIEATKGKLKRSRHLKQYRDLSDEQFEKVITQKALGIEVSEEFEKRIAKKWAEFEEDYDLSDLKINDRAALRALIQSIITLDDYEQYMFKLRSAGITQDTIMSTERLHKSMSDLRSDISKLQGDLNITRKVRKSDQDVSVLAFIDSLKEKARKFYDNKMSYVFCPKCNMLLGTFWVQYTEEDRNKIALVCNRVMPDGNKCGEKIIVSPKDLVKSRGTNKREITPDSML